MLKIKTVNPESSDSEGRVCLRQLILYFLIMRIRVYLRLRFNSVSLDSEDRVGLRQLILYPCLTTQLPHTILA